jgi:multimeric flavodoxin WrbA
MSRILGLSAGTAGGSAEIVLRLALAGCCRRPTRSSAGRSGAAGGADAELVRLADLDLTMQSDLDWLWEKLVECDALIVSTPIMSRTMAAGLKLLVDRLLGPNADAAIIEQLVAVRRAGNEPAVPFRVDERVLRPRVAGFLAVGGSLTPQWKTLTLPLMHTLTFSMHIAVVDQVVFGGAGTPRSVLLDDDALRRAATLGANVAGQLGKAYDEVTYLGEPGLCPMCHLSVIELTGTDVACATCGCRGTLRVGGAADTAGAGVTSTGTAAAGTAAAGTGVAGTGVAGTGVAGTGVAGAGAPGAGVAGTGVPGTGVAIEWTDRTTSVLSMDEKRAHAAEIQETAGRHRELQSTIAERAATIPAFAPVAPR